MTEVNIFIQLYISSDMYDTLHVSLIMLLVDTNKLLVNIIIFDEKTSYVGRNMLLIACM